MVKNVKSDQIYQIKITLKNSQPPIWRRIQVRSNITLNMLHKILQVVMPWEDYHLHQFIINGKLFSIDEDGYDGFMKTEDERKLYSYSKIFKTAEIDSTFYAYPSQGTVMGWLRYTPKDFIFTAKLPQIITHEKRLDVKQDVEGDVIKFVELMEPLYTNGKLGCLLVQLPPKLEFDLDLLENFLRVLPTQIKYAVEFRDASWLNHETFKVLRKYDVAYTIVDEPHLPPEIHVTADFAYFRWHGRGTRPWYNYRYKIEELKPWVPKIKEVAEKVKVIYGYFNNHFHGYAVENCLQLLEMLEELTPEQTEVKRKAQEYFERLTVKPTVEASSLEMFVDVSQLNFNSLLQRFIDDARLKRARK